MEELGENNPIERNLLALLEQVVPPGGPEATVAIHPVTKQILVFVEDDLVMSTTLDELERGLGGSPN